MRTLQEIDTERRNILGVLAILPPDMPERAPFENTLAALDRERLIRRWKWRI